MRYVRPQGSTGTSVSRSGASRRANWLIQWYQDKPDFVQLHCGHRTDLKERGTLVIPNHKDRRMSVYCEPCDSAQPIARRLTLAEWFNIELPPSTDTPPY